MQTTTAQLGAHTTQRLADMLIEAMHDHHEVRNRRGHERYPYSTPLRIGRLDDRAFHAFAEACSTDVSLTGMGLLTKSKLPVGSIVWLELKPGRPDLWRIKTKVVYSRPLFADIFRVGIAFLTH